MLACRRRAKSRRYLGIPSTAHLVAAEPRFYFSKFIFSCTHRTMRCRCSHGLLAPLAGLLLLIASHSKAFVGPRAFSPRSQQHVSASGSSRGNSAFRCVCIFFVFFCRRRSCVGGACAACRTTTAGHWCSKCRVGLLSHDSSWDEQRGGASNTPVCLTSSPVFHVQQCSCTLLWLCPPEKHLNALRAECVCQPYCHCSQRSVRWEMMHHPAHDPRPYKMYVFFCQGMRCNLTPGL